MEWIFGLIALIAALAGLVTSLGHGGYLYMLGSTASKRAGGEPIAKFARGRYGSAAIASAVGLIALIVAASSGFGGDIVALLLGLGATGYSMKALQTSKERLRVGGSAR